MAGDTDAARTLAAAMSDAWIAFARDGDPNHGTIPKWPAYSLDDRSTMIFDTECSVQSDPFGNERSSLDKLGLAW